MGDKHKSRDNAEAKVILAKTEDVWKVREREQPIHTRMATTQPSKNQDTDCLLGVS